ncbi:DUF6428 family protein [Robiginitalea sp. SC105]|uniref:DUF6428 family protein n=1 Tax=Robiginitalea sp. SC105 TaxID=2762332 RepID=UPI001639E307|nr:DUF6428 family protein [Robiginitalea sp. SC105]MBC2838526.1 hypothetical protein [Robiginitalea sp. SC105]
MKTSEFLELLQKHPGRMLNFEYAPGKRLRPDYHITEVKNIHIDATDCGGRSDSWKETVIQLWENPVPEPADRSITAKKALAILGRVAQKQPLLMDSLVKFEYGNADFHAAQLHVAGERLEGENLVVLLSPVPTQCKASDICGVPVTAKRTAGETPEAVEAAGCTPGTGCC